MCTHSYSYSSKSEEYAKEYRDNIRKLLIDIKDELRQFAYSPDKDFKGRIRRALKYVDSNKPPVYTENRRLIDPIMGLPLYELEKYIAFTELGRNKYTPRVIWLMHALENIILEELYREDAMKYIEAYRMGLSYQWDNGLPPFSRCTKGDRAVRELLVVASDMLEMLRKPDTKLVEAESEKV